MAKKVIGESVNKKIMFILLLIITSVLVLIYGIAQGRNDAKMVFNLPAEFVSLENEITSSEGALIYIFWESQISFLDSKGTCIYQTSVKNDSFIVKYKGKYYISESKYNELLEAVTNVRE